MTRPSKNSLVLDGNEIKLRLSAERSTTGKLVHIDWVRFTCNVRTAPTPSVDDLFPRKNGVLWAEEIDNRTRLAALLRDLPDADFSVAAQAKSRLSGGMRSLARASLAVRGCAFRRAFANRPSVGAQIAQGGFVEGGSDGQPDETITAHVSTPDGSRSHRHKHDQHSQKTDANPQEDREGHPCRRKPNAQQEAP